MILEGNERGFGGELARHLLNPRDNDHVTVHAVDGFIAADLTGALAETEAIAQGTQCQKYLFSLSLNPPPTANVTVEEFEETIARIEKKLGLTGQPRIIVFHEKNGRRHAHCAWSRINANQMRAINLSHSKRKLMDVSIALYREHGWEMPNGFRKYLEADPLNFSHAEAGQAKRTGHDTKALKALFKNCWAQSDSRPAFAAALWAEGYCLAKGDRRGYVAVDAEGKIWSLSRWCDIKPKELVARLGEPDDLPSTEASLRLFEGLPALERTTKAIVPEADFEENRTRLAEAQRREREALIDSQERRAAEENRSRQRRLPRGLKAVWTRLNGGYDRLVAELSRDAAACTVRDREERQALVERHLKDRRDLARRTSNLTKALEELFIAATRPDVRQRLVLPKEAVSFTLAQLAEKPSLILAHLSLKHARFSENDVKRALAAFIGNPLILRGAIDTALSDTGLVRFKNGDLTTQEYEDSEQKLKTAAAIMSVSGGFTVAGTHIGAAIREQNIQLRERFGGELSAEQRAALFHTLGDSGLSCVVGLAGAGKSTMLKTARLAWERQGMRVHGAALSGKAADGLQNASGIESRTLASLETSWKNGYEPIARGDVLVIDEAGMIGTRQMMRVAEKIHGIGAKLVLVGDPGQLQPIEAGKPFRQLIDDHGAAKLIEIHRQRAKWQRHASRDLAEGRLRDALEAYDADGSVHRRAAGETALAALLENYLCDRHANVLPITQLAFAHRRKDVFALNQAIRRALRSTDEKTPDAIFATETGPRAFGRGDRIVFTRNEKELGVKNGMLGTVENVGDDRIYVILDSDDGTARHVAFDPGRYQNFDHGYAVTIHKSQGATVERAYVLASRTMDEALAYVAMTRHRDTLRIFIDEEDKPAWALPESGVSRQQFSRARRFDRS